MRKDLIRRLEKLEASHPQIEIVGVLWCSTTVEMRRALAPNEAPWGRKEKSLNSLSTPWERQ
jgi:hypothetical protein